MKQLRKHYQPIGLIENITKIRPRMKKNRPLMSVSHTLYCFQVADIWGRYSRSIRKQLAHGLCTHFLHHKTEIQTKLKINLLVSDHTLWSENRLVLIHGRLIVAPSSGYHFLTFYNIGNHAPIPLVDQFVYYLLHPRIVFLQCRSCFLQICHLYYAQFMV